MQDYLATYLNEYFQEGYNNETQFMHTISETQSNDPFEDPGENLGRLQDYFEFLKSKIISESDYSETNTD